MRKLGDFFENPEKIKKLKIKEPLRFRKAGRVWFGGARKTH